MERMEAEEVENVDIRWLWRSFKLKRDEDQTSAEAHCGRSFLVVFRMGHNG